MEIKIKRLQCTRLKKGMMMFKIKFKFKIEPRILKRRKR